MLTIANLLSTIVQSILVSYFPYYCIKKDSKNKEDISKLKFLGSSLLIFASIELITIKMGGTSLSVILMDALNILIIVLFYFKSYNKAVISYSIISILFTVTSIIFGNIYWSYIEHAVNICNPDFSKLIGMYIPMYIIQLLIFVSMKKLYEIYRFLSRKKYCFEIILIALFSLDYSLSISLIVHGNDDTFFKNIFIISLIIFVFIACVYFTNLRKKFYEIDELNKALNEKNDELRKVKHDYGSQISYINGLYIMEQYERLGVVLKDIISGNEKISSNIKVLSDSDSIISVIVNSIKAKDTNIVVEEETDLSQLKISEYELQKILSNIINNAITAMNGEGLIFIKTYKIFNSLYINIKNNGPQIDEKIKDKIFEAGFTTKESKDNGFGLAIVKELVEKNNGKISLESYPDYTEFKIIFKI